MREYKTVCCDIQADFDACLNELAAEGWMVDQRAVVPRAEHPELLYAFLSKSDTNVFLAENLRLRRELEAYMARPSISEASDMVMEIENFRAGISAILKLGCLSGETPHAPFEKTFGPNMLRYLVDPSFHDYNGQCLRIIKKELKDQE
jgi:hypothetical protein